jgi:thioesterase domain-containing protein
MATLYVSEIKKVQPRGPYYLGGYCMGGTVALEMAQQLVRRGEKVALLALLDTLDWSKLPSDSIAQKIYRQSERLTFHLQNFLLLNLKEKIKFFHEKMQTLRSRSKVWQGMVLGRLFPGQTRSQSSILADIWEINDRAASNYVPQPFPGTITDFRPIKQYSALLKPEMKWDQVAGGGQEIITLPVYPAGMLVEPFVKKLGSALRTSIDKANRGTSPAS